MISGVISSTEQSEITLLAEVRTASKRRFVDHSNGLAEREVRHCFIYRKSRGRFIKAPAIRFSINNGKPCGVHHCRPHLRFGDFVTIAPFDRAAEFRDDDGQGFLGFRMNIVKQKHAAAFDEH